MRRQTVEQVLQSLASAEARPGGRVAALHAALGAALLARDGGEADDLREAALALAEGPPGAEAAERARAAVRVVELTERALGLAESQRPVGARSGTAVVGDVAAAAEALRAAAGIARVEVERELGAITDPAVREELLVTVDAVDDVVLRAAKVTAVVREQILR